MPIRSPGRAAAWLALFLAAVFHLGMLESLRSGRMNPLFDDSTHRKGQAVDFFTVYWGSLQGLGGHSLYTYDLPHGVGPKDPPYAYSNFRYFPAWGLSVGWLLTRPSPWAAYWLWVVLTEALLLLGAVWAWRLSGEWGIAPSLRPLIPALWLGFSPYYLELYLGQFTLPLALMILGLLALAGRGRMDALGRSWLASLFWKFATALYVPVFHRLRAWRLLAVAAALVLLFTAPYFAFHPHDALHFARYFVMGLGAKTHGGNHGLQALASVALETAWPGCPAIHLGGNSLPLWRLGMLLVTLSAVAACWRRTLLGRLDVPLLLCLWTAMYFALSRDVWEHHTLMLLPVLTWMLARLPAQRGWILASALLLVLPTPFHWIDVHGLAPEVDPEPFWSPAQRLLLHSWKALPALAILVVCYRGLGEGEPGPAAPR